MKTEIIEEGRIRMERRKRGMEIREVRECHGGKVACLVENEMFFPC